MIKKKQFIILFSMVLVISLIITGCSSKDSGAKKPESSNEQKPQAPPALESIRNDLDIIITATSNKIKMKNMSSLQQSAQVEPESSEDKSGSKKPKEQIGAWQKEEESLRKIHQNWNALEPEAIKARISEKSRNDFETALNELTLNIGKKMIEESLFAAVNLYKFYADLTDVFTMAIPPEFFRVKYEVMAATAEAGRQNWQAADENIRRAQEHWDNLKVQAKEADEKVSDRSKFSINDLEEAVKSEQLDLVMIKSEIVMKNLKILEEKF